MSDEPAHSPGQACHGQASDCAPKIASACAYKQLNELPLSKLNGSFHGVIQHSFALQLTRAGEFRETSGWLPRRARQARSSASFSALQYKHQQRAYKRLRTVFEDRTGAFAFKHPGEFHGGAGGVHGACPPGDYSWLIRERHTGLDPQSLALLEDTRESLPAPLRRAEHDPSETDPSSADGRKSEPPTWQGLVFAQRSKSSFAAGPARTIANDLLLAEIDSKASAESQQTAEILFELWAHWRSRLFGVSLAHRFFNIFLPHATLELAHPIDDPTPKSGVGSTSGEGAWLLQPFVSLVREPDRSHCRRTFTFTVLLLPIDQKGSAVAPEARPMSLLEIEASVRRAWGLAASRNGANRRPFRLDGPLRRYCENVGHGLPEEALTIRQWTEAALYRTTQLRRDRMQSRRVQPTRRNPSDCDLGDKVLTALASSRVSAVTVLDKELHREAVRGYHEAREENEAPEGLFPGSLPDLIRAVSGRTYLAPVASYRVDRPFLDRDTYAECAVPAARTLITSTTQCSQQRYEDSYLLQSVFSGYMALGAATAQALIRGSYHEIEANTDPKQFGEISKEFRRDFHEIYDLDIVWESYKRTYRSILEQFDIMNDYEALRRKLEMIFNATVAEFTEWQHTRLWFLTLVLILATVLLIVLK